MTCCSSLMKWVCAGAASVIAATSFSSMVACIRFGTTTEPYVWIENPMGHTVCGSAAWHALLGGAFVAVPVLLFARPSRREGGAAGTAFGLSRTLSWFIAVLAGLAVLAIKDSIVFYWLLSHDQIHSGFPVPLSLFLVCLLAASVILITRITQPMKNSRWLWIPLRLGWFGSGAMGLVLLHLFTFGSTDYTRHADVAIVLGARVYRDGTPSLALSDRLETGIQLYAIGQVQYLLVTGGIGEEGQDEAQTMRRMAMEAGVPEDRILVDEHGCNTLMSAQGCHRLLDEQGLTTALVISHYYHLARCKMLFTEYGIHCWTVPARMSRRLVKEPYFLLRECIAYLGYSVGRAWRPTAEPA